MKERQPQKAKAKLVTKPVRKETCGSIIPIKGHDQLPKCESGSGGDSSDSFAQAQKPVRKEMDHNITQAISFASVAIILAWLLIAGCMGIHSNEVINSLGLYSPIILRNYVNLGQVLFWLPAAAVACGLLSGVAMYLARESQSRDIDWTDSHLFLEYSGPLTLALKWTAIESVRQGFRWDILNGKQPTFVVTTKEGNVFKLKLSDISRKHNIGTFFSMIKTNAPHAMLGVDASFAHDHSYTELWLKYFSTPTERERTGMLEKDMRVDCGRYRVHCTIGGGGQGTAYLATVEEQISFVEQTGETSVQHIMTANRGLNSQPGEQVVLKEYVLPVHRGHLTTERTAERLKAEAEILSRLDHPQIVKLEDAFIEDYRGYLVLEYVQGESLKTLVERLGPQLEESVIQWSMQVCKILEYLHSLEPCVVHRDITPDNLLLQEDGFIKLVDFNVAYQVDSSSTATVVGKHAYIPAEQFRGKPTPQSDIYALGGTMFFLLTGKEPEPITQSHPRRVNAAVGESLDQIVAHATASSLKDRTASVGDLHLALSKTLSKQKMPTA